MPELVFRDVLADRYENGARSVTFSADHLEMYGTDRVWAASGISFLQYSSDDPEKIEINGSAGLLLVDEAEELYSLGGQIEFYVLSSNSTLKAPDVRWSKKTRHLAAPANAVVTIEKEDGTKISGSGFTADTGSHTYAFERSVSGQLISSKKDLDDK